MPSQIVLRLRAFVFPSGLLQLPGGPKLFALGLPVRCIVDVRRLPLLPLRRQLLPSVRRRDQFILQLLTLGGPSRGLLFPQLLSLGRFQSQLIQLTPQLGIILLRDLQSRA